MCVEHKENTKCWNAKLCAESVMVCLNLTSVSGKILLKMFNSCAVLECPLWLFWGNICIQNGEVPILIFSMCCAG